MNSGFVYLLTPLVAWLIAQTIKVTLQRGKKDQTGFSKYLSSGDMPSAHTAVVASLATAIFVHEGVSSLFAVAATLAAVTIYDALVARRSIGEQGRALLKLIEKSSFAKDPLPLVALGHKPLEVLAGLGLGTVTGALVAFFITI